VDLGIGVVPDWIITGGESGPRARAMRPDWAREVIAECERLNIAPFHKQWGNYESNPLVCERGLSRKEAATIDTQGKGGGNRRQAPGSALPVGALDRLDQDPEPGCAGCDQDHRGLKVRGATPILASNGKHREAFDFKATPLPRILRLIELKILPSLGSTLFANNLHYF
jgi:Protein of unknown function (DUF5131)